MDKKELTAQNKAEKLIEINVMTQQSALMDEMLKKGIVDYPIMDEHEGGEIMEWWLITEWLAGKLREHGEVIGEYSGNFWWGRQTTGQEIKIDSVIQEIAEDIF